MAVPGDTLEPKSLKSLRSALHPVIPALVVALPPLFWVVDATHRASLTTLGRDQGIFQYIAWAVTHGAKDYRDVRDVNGPLTHFIHMVFMWLGGADEHRFRILDLVVTGASFAFVGACLPGIGRRVGTLRAQIITRAAWAFAAWVVLSGQYLLYLFWDLAQRESFFDWFLLGSAGLQLVAQAGLKDGESKRHERLLVLAFALSVVTWFGKPTYLLFTIPQVLTLLVDNQLHIGWRRRLRLAGIGALAAVVSQLLFLIVYADIGAFLRIYLVDVPTMYRFIWPRTMVEILSMGGAATNVVLTFVTSAIILGLIWDRQMPRRALVIAFLPLCGVLSVAIQKKGFPYHFHPVTVGLHLEWLLLVVWLWERLPLRSQRRVRGVRSVRTARLLPLLAGSGLALRVALVMPLSPHLEPGPWILTKARDSEERAGHDYLVYFQTPDFFPWEMRQTADYLRAHTTPTDRVQIYGMDPYVLFLAQRMSATPFIYAYDLNADAALAGGLLPDPTGLHPTMHEAARIRALRDAHEQDLVLKLKREPPAAFVFMDKAPLISWQDAWLDFSEHNKDTAIWVNAHYKETVAFGVNHVWMRLDLLAALPEGKELLEAAPRPMPEPPPEAPVP